MPNYTTVLNQPPGHDCPTKITSQASIGCLPWHVPIDSMKTCIPRSHYEVRNKEGCCLPLRASKNNVVGQPFYLTSVVESVRYIKSACHGSRIVFAPCRSCRPSPDGGGCGPALTRPCTLYVCMWWQGPGWVDALYIVIYGGNPARAMHASHQIEQPQRAASTA